MQEGFNVGGHISVGVRRLDGSFRTIGVWTNPLGPFMRERAFRIDGSLDPLDKFFAHYLKEDADFGGPQETVPGEYGFVLVDEITRTIMNMNNYASPNWVQERDLGFMRHGRLFATEEALAEMAEMREGAVRARYFLGGGGDWIHEDLPAFTTHERMFSLMDELSRRGREQAVEQKISQALAAVEDALAKPDDAEFDAKLRRADWKVDDIRRTAEHHSVLVQYEIGFPAWTVRNLRPGNPKDIEETLAAVESCTELTDAERAEWNAYLSE